VVTFRNELEYTLELGAIPKDDIALWFANLLNLSKERFLNQEGFWLYVNGYVLVFVVLALITLVVALLGLCFRKRPNCMGKVVRFLQTKLFYSKIIKSFLAAQLGLALGAFEGIKARSDLAFSIFTLVALIWLTVATAVFFEVHLDKEGFFDKNRPKFGNLYKTLVTTRRGGLHFTTVFLVRRILLALSLVMSGTLILQVALHALLSIAMIVYVIQFEPFFKRVDFVIEIVNELAILAIAYTSLGFADNIVTAD